MAIDKAICAYDLLTDCDLIVNYEALTDSNLVVLQSLEITRSIIDSSGNVLPGPTDFIGPILINWSTSL